jgi:predicted histidine transporter YuiF (NhaC family)
MFIDFFEIAFIVVPLLAPVAEKLGIDLIWFGIILAMNLQTSFLTPPFGFALFYLRSVAARSDYTDVVTKKRIPAVTTAQIYIGSIAFIVLQLIMVSAVVMYPSLVTGNLEKAAVVDDASVTNMLQNTDTGQDDSTPAEEAAADANALGQKPEANDGGTKEEDPMKALEEATKKP